MANLNIPTKEPGQQHFSSEYNAVKDWNNSPMTNLGTFNVIVDFSTQGYYTDRTLSGNETWNFTNLVAGIGQYSKITVPQGTTITLTSARVINGSLDNLDAGTYDVYMFCPTGQEVHLSIPGSSSSPVTPTINSVVVSSTQLEYNRKIVLELNTGVYGDAGASTPVDLSDWNIQFAQNTGTCTGISVSSVKQNDAQLEADASALVGGESTIAIFFAPDDSADGQETITVNPATSSSVYNASGVAMQISESGQDNLNAFNPLELTPLYGLVASGSDQFTFETGSTVETWISQTGSFDGATSPPFNGPTYDDTNKWVRMSSTNSEGVHIPITSSNMQVNQAKSFYMVGKSHDPLVSPIFASVKGSDAANRWTIQVPISGPDIDDYRYLCGDNAGTSVAKVKIETVNTTVNNYMSMRTNDGNTSVKLEFGTATLNATPAAETYGTGQGELSMNASSSVGTPVYGDIDVKETWGFNRMLSDTENARIKTYLKNKHSV